MIDSGREESRNKPQVYGELISHEGVKVTQEGKGWVSGRNVAGTTG